MRGEARYGLEHELALLRDDGTVADHRSLTHAEVAAVVDELPELPDDQSDLRIGAAGIRCKRWYAEGYERLDPDGELLRFEPKGIEIRTCVHDSVEAAVDALAADAVTLAGVAARHGLRPVAFGHHPELSAYRLDPPPNAHERALMAASPEERTSHLHMVTWGPDLNLSFPESGTDPRVLADAAAKLTFYSPYLVPWSFSSPFRDGRPWGGLPPGAPLLATDPSLVRHAGIPGEVGRLEFKAFDAVPVVVGEEPAEGVGTELPAALLSLLTGLLRDDTLPGRRRTPDAAAHRRSALRGWSDAAVRVGSQAVLDAAATALAGDDAHLARLASLARRLARRETPADRMLARHRAGGGIPGLGHPVPRGTG